MKDYAADVLVVGRGSAGCWAAHYREDDPEPDHTRWLKWVLLKKGENGMRLSTVHIPKDHDEKHAVRLPISDRTQ